MDNNRILLILSSTSEPDSWMVEEYRKWGMA